MENQIWVDTNIVIETNFGRQNIKKNSINNQKN